MPQLIRQLQRSGWLFIPIITVLGGIGLLGMDFQSRESSTRQLEWSTWNTQPATALSAPQLLANGFLWFPPGDNALVYQPFEKDAPLVHTGLAGTPVYLRAVRAGLSDFYHVVWLNDRDELWHAQLNTEAQFVLPPVRLQASPVLEFSVAPLSGGGAVILFTVPGPIRYDLHYVVLDAEARPRFDGRLLSEVDRFAFVVDLNESLDLAWTSAQSDATKLNWARFPVQDLRAVSPPDLLTLTQPIPINLPDRSWLSELAVRRDDDLAMIISGYTTADSPEQTHYRLWSSTTTQEQALTIQQNGEPVRTRWLGMVDHFSVFDRAPRIALTAFLGGTWRAILAVVSPEGITNYQVLGSVAANGSAPAVWYDAPQNIHAAWVRLDEQRGLFNTVVSNRADYLSAPEPEDTTFTFGDALEGWLYLPYGLVWLVLPVGVLLARLNWPDRQQIPILVGLYWMSKVILSGDWLRHFPTGISWGESTYVLLLTAFAISPMIIALPFWIAKRWRRFVLLVLTLDALLTMLVFGSNLAT